MNDAERERIQERPTGPVAARLHGVEEILRRRAHSARDAARALPKSDQAAAALRGKAKGLEEAVMMLDRLDQGRPLRGNRGRPYDRNPNLPAAVTRCEQQCPECESTSLHHCMWDGLVCLDCGWEENPL